MMPILFPMPGNEALANQIYRLRAWELVGAARVHCRRGIGVWEWASSAAAAADAVLACAGRVPTLEALAAAQLLYQQFPMLKLRLVNIVDLMTLQPPYARPHLSEILDWRWSGLGEGAI